MRPLFSLSLCTLALGASLVVVARSGPRRDPGEAPASREALAAPSNSKSDSPSTSPSTSGQDDASALLTQALARSGIHLDLNAGVVATSAQVEVTDELLEYLVVLPHGSSHEAMLVLGAGRSPKEAMIWTQALNSSLLALGVKPGQNARWIPKDPKPSIVELRAGVRAYDVLPPEGDGLFLYVTWREGDERYFFRLEDLIRDLERGRSMRRHRWVYLGSRMIERRGDTPDSFAAGLEGNLVNISFFAEGNTLLTGALPECLNQTTWLPNAWLLPPRGSEVLLVFSRERLDTLPASLEAIVPGGD